ncbi:MAG TPA: prolipoprotein diacylglyceryl transferase family protein [Candidatus Limnocylindrales bacterium]|nr:prolipoprotein diacylglyceryl transferase family protein [Candidatus Limnocylindrales bacterium]
MPIFVFEFDPLLRLGDLAIRWEAIGIAGSILFALLLAVVLGRRGGPGSGPRTERYRADDLLYIALGAVPGAVVGGRLGYVLHHLDYYGADTGAIMDPAQGGLQLSLAVLGGTLTGGYVAALVGASVRGWMHVAALPLLLAIEGGKAAMAWGGSGQGVASTDLPRTAYLGPGPWGSLGPAIPSVPSQLLEAGAVAVAGIVLVALMAAGGFRRRDGRLYLAAAALWLAGRLLIAATWRDPAAVGPLNVDQVISVALLGAVAVAWFVVGRRAGPDSATTSAIDGPAWPDETAIGVLRRPEPAAAPPGPGASDPPDRASSGEG